MSYIPKFSLEKIEHLTEGVRKVMREHKLPFPKACFAVFNGEGINDPQTRSELMREIGIELNGERRAARKTRKNVSRNNMRIVSTMREYDGRIRITLDVGGISLVFVSRTNNTVYMERMEGGSTLLPRKTFLAARLVAQDELRRYIKKNIQPDLFNT